MSWLETPRIPPSRRIAGRSSRGSGVALGEARLHWSSPNMDTSRTTERPVTTWFRAALAGAALAGTSLFALGCLCGAAAVPTSGDGHAMVTSDGVVVYDATPV